MQPRRTALHLSLSLLLFFVFPAPAFQPVLPRERSVPNASVFATGNTYVVNSTLDEPDSDPANGVCSSTPSRVCTLRAAIMVANFAPGSHTVTLPAGVYILTRPGYDDNALVGDLDISHNLTLQGAGSGATIVDGNGSVTKDRVFQMLSSATSVTMTGITIRNGQSLSSTIGVIGGGGLYLEGSGHLLLNDVIIAGNTGQNGGGLYANFSSQGGSIEMDQVVVRANTATAGGVGVGGGLDMHLPSNLSQVTLQDSQVYSNTADGTGGGLYIDGNNTAQWSIQRSAIYSNTAASGGGIGNFIPLALSDSRLHDNHATFDGGAIEAFSPLALLRTTLDANSAGRFGGGIFDLQTASDASYSEFAHIEESTLSRNAAQYGGGIYHDGFITPNSLLTLINSTVSSNVVFRPRSATGRADGGGIYVYGGQLQLLNATIASNRVQLGFPSSYPGIGGGVYITATATFTAENSLIANNTRGDGIRVNALDDCFSSGTVGTLAYNLILTTTNCYVTGPQGGNIVGQDPRLGALQNNGGSTQTQALLAGSPAIDAAAPAGCIDVTGVALTTDQRGFDRPANGGVSLHCDMGAYELHPMTWQVQPGWNLVGNPDANPLSVSTISATLGANLVALYSYDCTSWHAYGNGTANNLTAIPAGAGAWLKVNTAQTVVFPYHSGVVPALCTGWNLISVNLGDTPGTWQNAGAMRLLGYTALGWQQAGVSLATYVQTLTTLTSGQGLWVKK